MLAIWGLGHELEGEDRAELMVGVEVEGDVRGSAVFLWIRILEIVVGGVGAGFALVSEENMASQDSQQWWELWRCSVQVRSEGAVWVGMGM